MNWRFCNTCGRTGDGCLKREVPAKNGRLDKSASFYLLSYPYEGAVYRKAPPRMVNGKFLYSAESNSQGGSKRFTSYFPDRPVQSDTISTLWETFILTL